MEEWLLWRNGVWESDRSHAIEGLADHTARSLFHDTAGILDGRKRDELVRWAKKSLSGNGIRSMISLARHKVTVSVDALDQQRWLLNCRNGTVDLKTGTLREHRQSDRLTKQIPIDFDPTAQCPAFEKFIAEITGGDSDLAAFLARAVGYSLTGDTSEQCFFVAYGEGANGKSTLLTVIRKLLGTYAQNAPMTTFLVKRNDGGANGDVARMRGARFVTAVESGPKRKMDDPLIKQFTGGDPKRRQGFMPTKRTEVSVRPSRSKSWNGVRPRTRRKQKMSNSLGKLSNCHAANSISH